MVETATVPTKMEDGVRVADFSAVLTPDETITRFRRLKKNPDGTWTVRLIRREKSDVEKLHDFIKENKAAYRLYQEKHVLGAITNAERADWQYLMSKVQKIFFETLT